MIESVRLANFKAFKDLRLQFRAFNLLSGLNGVGKSSLIQSLLLLRQSHNSGDLASGRITLNGPLAEIGTASDLLFVDAEKDEIHIGLTYDGTEAAFTFRVVLDEEASRDEVARRLTPHEGNVFSAALLHGRPLLGTEGLFQYLCAERLGPRKSMPMSDNAAVFDLGKHGEYTLHFLSRYGKSLLLKSDDARFAQGAPARLIDQVDHWLQEISPGAHLELQEVRAADLMISGFAFDRPKDAQTRAFRATNVRKPRATTASYGDLSERTAVTGSSFRLIFSAARQMPAAAACKTGVGRRHLRAEPADGALLRQKLRDAARRPAIEKALPSTADQRSRLVEPDGDHGWCAVSRLHPALEKLDDDHAPAAIWARRQELLGRLVLTGTCRRLRCRRRRAQQLAQPDDVTGAACVGEQPVMADAMKALRQDVEHEAADELVCRQRHHLPPGHPVRAIVLVAKGDAALIMGDEPRIRDRHPVGVAREIGEHRLRPRERLPHVDEPVFPAQRFERGGEGGGRRQLGEAALQDQAALAVCRCELFQHKAPSKPPLTPNPDQQAFAFQ
jgi:hypothetical protein